MTRVINQQAEFANLRERRLVMNEMWECIPLHPIRWLRLNARMTRLVREGNAISRGVERVAP